MNWIDEAVRSADTAAQQHHAKRQQAEEDATAFVAELPITEDSVVAFLEPFASAIAPILLNLEEAGFTVEAAAPSYIYDSDSESKKRDYLAQFSLAKMRFSYRGITDYRVEENHVFGLAWHIRHPDTQYLASIHLYPKADARTHYAAAQYIVPGSSREPARFSKEIADLSGARSVINELKEVLTELIQENAIQSKTR